MPSIDRRRFLLGGASALLAAPAFAQTDHSMHGGQYESLRKPGRMGLPEIAASRHVFDSPAPKAANPGRWIARAPLPTGRDHTGTLTVGKLIHVIGGRVDSFHTNSNLHHAYDAQKDRWEPRRPLPTARSGHGAVLYRGRIFVMGGGVQSAIHEAFTLG